MALTDPTAVDTLDAGLPMEDVGRLIDTLGNCIEQNADKSAGSEASADDAKNFAQAALYAAQALAALVPYQDPTAPNAPGDNAAKKGD